MVDDWKSINSEIEKNGEIGCPGAKNMMPSAPILHFGGGHTYGAIGLIWPRCRLRGPPRRAITLGIKMIRGFCRVCLEIYHKAGSALHDARCRYLRFDDKILSNPAH